MGKKKQFIDKKKSATFQLLARDSSDPSFSDSPGADRVFVRVDNNPVPIAAGFISAADHDGDDPYAADHNPLFDDAPDDDDDDVEEMALGISTSYASRWSGGGGGSGGQAASLPEDARREILELGFPDDGYNYLIHLREIKNAGGGSAFYHNPKFRVEHIPRDVKAYDASRVRISEDDPEQNSIYSVASKTTAVRVQKVVDLEVAALLDDSDLSRFGSDVEDLEEDFVVRANLHEHEDEEEGKADICDDKNFAEEAMINRNQNNAQVLQISAHSRVAEDVGSMVGITNGVIGVDCADEKPRARRLLDEQFDLLEHNEYGIDDDDDDGDYYENYRAEENESLAEKLKCSLNNIMMDDLEHSDGKYKVPAHLLKNKEAPEIEEEDCAADVIRRCKEYAEGYEVEDGNEDKDVVLVQESSDESEAWDCETIVSTYSTLDNHPGKIGAPEVTRKKKLAETVYAALSSSSPIISLRGKEKLPVDYLPGSRKPAAEKVKGQSTARTEQYKRKPHGQESKEEKKERKAAVKEDRREARRIKKEMKGLYRGEAHRAQRVAAISGPSSIHLM